MPIGHLYVFFGTLCLFLIGNVHCSKHTRSKDEWRKAPPLSGFPATWLSSLKLPVCIPPEKLCTFKPTIGLCCILSGGGEARPPDLCFKPTQMLRGQWLFTCTVSCISETVGLFNKCFQIHPCCSMYQNFIPGNSLVVQRLGLSAFTARARVHPWSGN